MGIESKKKKSVCGLNHFAIHLKLSQHFLLVSCCCHYSVAQSFLTLCGPMDCSTPGFPILFCLPELAQTHVHPTILSSVVPFSSWLQSFPVSGSFQMTWIFASGGQSVEASASASVLPMNIQGWLPLGLTGLISLLSKGLSRVFSSTTEVFFFFFF